MKSEEFQSPLMQKLRKEEEKTQESKAQTTSKKEMIIEVESAKKEGPFKKVYTPLNNARNGKNGKADNPMFSSNMKRSGLREELPTKSSTNIRVKTEVPDHDDS